MNRPAKPGTMARGPIHADTLYPLDTLKAALGWGARGLANARARGLRVLRFGRWDYVKGADLILFLESVQTGERVRITEGSHSESGSDG